MIGEGGLPLEEFDGFPCRARTDAQKDRERILEVAKQEFTQSGINAR
jgi:hypothetical protein